MKNSRYEWANIWTAIATIFACMFFLVVLIKFSIHEWQDVKYDLHKLDYEYCQLKTSYKDDGFNVPLNVKEKTSHCVPTQK